jgi:hypothetical protein
MAGRRGNSDARRSSVERLEEVSTAQVSQIFWKPRTFHDVLHECLVAEDFEDILMGARIHGSVVLKA